MRFFAAVIASVALVSAVPADQTVVHPNVIAGPNGAVQIVDPIVSPTDQKEGSPAATPKVATPNVIYPSVQGNVQPNSYPCAPTKSSTYWCAGKSYLPNCD